MKSKSSKTQDMKWHWLREKEVLEQLRVYWDKGTNNDTDYFTKHLPQIHRRQMGPFLYTYLKFSEDNSSDHKIMGGCVELSPGYSVPYRIPEGDTSKTTIYEREMSYGHTVKPFQTTHNVAH